MNWYDSNRIIEDARPIDVARALGIETKNMGRNTFILCPGHLQRKGRPDRHFGNARLTPHGYVCESCGKTVSVIGMTMEVLNCSYPEALEFVAELNGGKEQYLSPESAPDNIRKFCMKDGNPDLSLEKIRPLGYEQLKQIGLNPEYPSNLVFNGFRYPISFFDYVPEFIGSNRGAYAYLDKDNDWKYNWIECDESKEKEMSLGALYRENYEAYLCMIVRKCLEKVDEINFLLDIFSDDNNGNEFVSNLNYTLMKNKRDINKIIDNFMSAMTEYQNFLDQNYIERRAS